jgi:hypothetical protein
MSDSSGDPLVRLQEEELEISRRRRRLHGRIEFVATSGAYDTDTLTLLDHLRAEERELSRVRRALHARIAGLRAQAGVGGVAPAASETKDAVLDTSRTGAYAASMRPE